MIRLLQVVDSSLFADGSKTAAMVADLLSELSDWTWRLLRDAPFRPREETVTEVLLTEFFRRGAGRVLVQKSTVADEAACGLDWAMAMKTPAGWLLALVQAKNVDGQRFGVYPGLRRESAQGQAEALIHAAALANAAPLYVLYNSEVSPFGEAGSRVEVGGCRRSVLVRGPFDGGLPWQTHVSPLGVMIAHADDIHASVIPPPAANQRALNVNQFAMPWECLFCPTWRHSAPHSTSSAHGRQEPKISALAEL